MGERLVVLVASLALLGADTRPTAAQAPASLEVVGAPAPMTDWVRGLRTPAGAFTGSLVIPGSGQAALGLRRWAAYVALEAVAWGFWLDATAAERSAARGYRDLAWEEARLRTSDREDGGWGYYETMSEYLRSGAYDGYPATPGLQPEHDSTTYNGAVWALARSIYLPGGAADPSAPEYDDALEYYMLHAVSPRFLWSWEGRPEALARFRGLIGDADAAARRATSIFGAVLANHMVAAVDAYVVASFRSDTGLRLESRLVPTDPVRWELALRISR